MTDAENQRQRDYAATLIAQCDGKTVQFYAANGTWIVMNSPLYKSCLHTDTPIRIKPEPREWWICVECSSLFAHNHNYHYRHELKSVTLCSGVLIHVREIFEP